MRERRWTIMVVPQGSAASRVVELSGTAIKLIASLAVTMVVLMLLLGYATFSRSLDLSRAEELSSENERLALTLGQIQGRLSLLEDTLATIETRDARIRVLANLDPIDPEVRAAGIGGPALAATSSSVLLGQAATVRADVNALLRRASLLHTSFSEAAESLAVHADRLEKMPSIIPTAGWMSSSFSSLRPHPVLGTARPHEGIDIVAPRGTPILAPGAGVVISARWEAGYGNTIVIDHGHGIVTRYAHTSRMLARPGQRIVRGDRIALVGNSGLSTSPHLHYEVHVNGRPVNPLRYILPSVVTD